MSIDELGDKLTVIHTEIDVSLVDMVRENERIIRSYMHCGGGKSLWDAEIAWDFPAQVDGDVWDEDAAKLSHAIGFISGVAAACDVTPLELLDVVAQMGPSRREKAAAVDVPTSGKRAIDGDPAYAGVILQRGAMARIAHPKELAKRKPSQRRQKLPKVK